MLPFLPDGLLGEMSADRSDKILDLLLSAILASESLQVVRGNLYAVLVQFER